MFSVETGDISDQTIQFLVSPWGLANVDTYESLGFGGIRRLATASLPAFIMVVYTVSPSIEFRQESRRADL